MFRDRMVLISDSGRCAGEPEGTKFQLGGQDAWLRGGVAKLADGTIACSATNLWTCLQNVLKWNVPEEEAIRAATFNPAKAIGAADKVGTIETGKLLRSITIKGMPLLVNEFLWSSGMAVLNQCYSTCGLDVVPAMNICSTLFNLGSVVYLSMGNSVGIIMGQMLGAGHSEEDVRDTNRKLIAVSIASGVVFGGLMAAVSEAFPGIYNTTDAVRHLAAQLIWISAVMMPFGSYLNATYFTLRSGGQTFVTFLFDSCFMWVFCVPLAFCLSRFTNLPILPLYAICQATDFIKCVIGTVMLKQGKWIQNLTV